MDIISSLTARTSSRVLARPGGGWSLSQSVSGLLRVHTPRVGQTVSVSTLPVLVRQSPQCWTSDQCDPVGLSSVFSVVITGLQVGGRWNFGVIWDKSLVNDEKFSKEGCQRHIFFVCERYRVL